MRSTLTLIALGALLLGCRDPQGTQVIELDDTGAVPDPDEDGDDVIDDEDNCVDVANPDQADLDGDEIGDLCDDDRDGDGVDNGIDAFPDDGEESADSDGDGVGDNADAFPADPLEWDDTDGDGFGDNDADNCVDVANPDQANLDGDELGDLCDSDVDGDGHDGVSAGGADCDDLDAAINPAATEIWYDGVDQDCAGDDDFDADGDGALALSAGGMDCDDDNAQIQGCGQSPEAAGHDCAANLLGDPAAADGTFWINPLDSGDPADAYQVLCDMTTAGGGWTGILVTADDGTSTWTWNNKDYLMLDTTLVGDISAPDQDYKSAAYHDLLFTDLLFTHQPSGVTAAYDGVGDGTMDLGTFIAGLAFPICDFGLDGNGYELTGGTLTVTGRMCDTDLHFNFGDHENGISSCSNLGASSNNATIGPHWSTRQNNSCPFDDPARSGMGPVNPDCSNCPGTYPNREEDGRGFGEAAGFDANGHYLTMWAR